MIQLEIPKRDEANLTLVDKLTELALAHQVRINKQIKEAILTDGSNQYKGMEAIHQYIEETKEELHQWWYCAC